MFGGWQCLFQIQGGRKLMIQMGFLSQRPGWLAYLAEKSLDGRTGDDVGDGYKKV
jgi:hypothetical protein